MFLRAVSISETKSPELLAGDLALRVIWRDKGVAAELDIGLSTGFLMLALGLRLLADSVIRVLSLSNLRSKISRLLQKPKAEVEYFRGESMMGSLVGNSFMDWLYNS